MGDMGVLWDAYKQSRNRHKNLVYGKRMASALRQESAAVAEAQLRGSTLIRRGETGSEWLLKLPTGQQFLLSPGVRRVQQILGKRLEFQIEGATAVGWFVAVVRSITSAGIKHV